MSLALAGDIRVEKARVTPRHILSGPEPFTAFIFAAAILGAHVETGSHQLGSLSEDKSAAMGHHGCVV